MGRKDKGERGLTLLETLVALAVFGLVLGAVATIVATCNIAWKRGQNQAEVQHNGRVVLDRMTREIRVSGYDLAGVIATLPNPSSIQAAEANRLTLVGDVDRDGALDQVTYRLSGQSLIRELSSWDGTSFPAPAGDTLGHGFTVLNFSYYDGSDAALAAPVAAADLHQVRRITIALVITALTAGREVSVPLADDVRVRNLCHY